MAGLNALEIGKRALLAQRFGLDVTANNIANVNTKGYTRQRAVLVETKPQAIAAGQLGTGVMLGRVDRVRQEFFDREVRVNSARAGTYQSDSLIGQRIEAALSESSEYGLDSTIKQFFSTFQSFALRPESLDKRQQVLDAGGALVAKFKTIGQALDSLRSDVKTKFEVSVQEINRTLDNIARFNQEIVATKAAGQDEAGPLNDQRILEIEKLAKYGNVQVTMTSDDVANVSIAGNTVVTGAFAAQLEAREYSDAATGERTLKLVQVNSQGEVLANIVPTAGEITSLLRNYNVTLDGNDSSGGFSVTGQINSIAAATVSKVNALHSTGYGLDDTGATPPGRNFFTPGTAASPVTALNISIDAGVADQPRNIAAADTAGEEGNNTIARQIAGLVTDQSYISNSTVGDYYASLVARIGGIGADANNGISTTDLLGKQLESQREAINGVSLDDEAIELIKYQKGFEAAARVINMANEVMGTLVNLGK